MPEFFDMTIGRSILNSRAHVRLKPEARALIKEKSGCTDEELDAALELMGQQMTETAHSDIKKMRQRTLREQTGRFVGLLAKAKEKKANDQNAE